MFLHFKMRPAGNDGWQSDLFTACEQLHPGRLCNVSLQQQARRAVTQSIIQTKLDMALFLQRISAYDRLTNAVREVVPDVMNTAATMDVMLAAFNANGTALPLLFCVPILIKDNFDATDGEESNICNHLAKVWVLMCYTKLCICKRLFEQIRIPWASTF